MDSNSNCQATTIDDGVKANLLSAKTITNTIAYLSVHLKALKAIPYTMFNAPEFFHLVWWEE